MTRPLAIIILAIVAAIGWFLWPTMYKYENDFSSGFPVQYRTNRFTNEVQLLTPEGWIKWEVPPVFAKSSYKVQNTIPDDGKPPQMITKEARVQNKPSAQFIAKVKAATTEANKSLPSTYLRLRTDRMLFVPESNSVQIYSTSLISKSNDFTLEEMIRNDKELIAEMCSDSQDSETMPNITMKELLQNGVSVEYITYGKDGKIMSKNKINNETCQVVVH